PRLVVDLALKADHPLHTSFDWDDRTAGDQWRLEQARALIRSVRVVYREADQKHGPATVRAYHSLHDEDGHAYRSVEDIAADPFLTKLVLANMQRAWQDLKRQYGHLAEFVDMVRKDVTS
ncbi:MAG: hypothetical protein ACREF4_15085, partial [Gammaproteobacteria bacterium]